MSLYCTLSLHSSRNLGLWARAFWSWGYKAPFSTVFLVSESQLSEPRVPPLLNGENSSHLEFLGFNEKTGLNKARVKAYNYCSSPPLRSTSSGLGHSCLVYPDAQPCWLFRCRAARIAKTTCGSSKIQPVRIWTCHWSLQGRACVSVKVGVSLLKWRQQCLVYSSSAHCMIQPSLPSQLFYGHQCHSEALVQEPLLRGVE